MFDYYTSIDIYLLYQYGYLIIILVYQLNPYRFQLLSQSLPTIHSLPLPYSPLFIHTLPSLPHLSSIISFLPSNFLFLSLYSLLFTPNSHLFTPLPSLFTPPPTPTYYPFPPHAVYRALLRPRQQPRVHINVAGTRQTRRLDLFQEF